MLTGNDTLVFQRSETLEQVSALTTASGPTPAGGAYAYWVVSAANTLMLAWAPVVASMYQLYRIRSMRVRWVSSAPSTMPGEIVLAFAYDPDDTLPTDYQSLAYLQGAWSGAVRDDGEVTFDGRQALFPQYTCLSNGTFVKNRFSSPGYFVYCIRGATPGAALGRLIVDYDFEFLRAGPLERPINMRTAWNNTSVSVTSGQQWLIGGDPIRIPRGSVDGWIQSFPNVSNPGLGYVVVDKSVESIMMVITAVGLPEVTTAAWSGVDKMVLYTSPITVVAVDGSTDHPICREYAVTLGDNSIQSDALTGLIRFTRPATSSGSWRFRWCLNYLPTYVGSGVWPISVYWSAWADNLSDYSALAPHYMLPPGSSPPTTEPGEGEAALPDSLPLQLMATAAAPAGPSTPALPRKRV